MPLPHAPTARAGERVRWYLEARPLAGIVIGHDLEGNAVIIDDFGVQHRRPFEEVRLESPFDRQPPLWHRLPAPGTMRKPSAAMADRFSQALARRVPPGASYQDLVEEIWSRGYEVFVVGGTVRDILAGLPTEDVDLVTTMPLKRMLGWIQEMWRPAEAINDRWGHIRLGESPHIDIRAFSHALPGTRAAVFGGGFETDLLHRDFTCNALYWEPNSQVLLDPSGRGEADVESRTLRLLRGNHNHHQMGQIFVRAIKFMMRGFTPAADTREILVHVYKPMLAAMKPELRRAYFRQQIIGPTTDPNDIAAARGAFIEVLDALGCVDAWKAFFAGPDEQA